MEVAIPAARANPHPGPRGRMRPPIQLRQFCGSNSLYSSFFSRGWETKYSANMISNRGKESVAILVQLAQSESLDAVQHGRAERYESEDSLEGTSHLGNKGIEAEHRIVGNDESIAGQYLIIGSSATGNNSFVVNGQDLFTADAVWRGASNPHLG